MARFTHDRCAVYFYLAEIGGKMKMDVSQLAYSRHFWRGMLDADGSLYYQNNEYPCFAMTSTMNGISAFILYCSQIS